MNQKKSDKWAAFYAACATVLWSTIASAFKLTLDFFEHNVFNLVFWASFVSFLVFLISLAVTGRFPLLLKTERPVMIRSAALGFLNPTLYYLILLNAYDRLPGQQALPINFFWPIVLTLLTVVLLRKPLGVLGYLGMLLSFFGVVLIATQGQLSSMHITDAMGSGLALSSTLIWATYWFFSMSDLRDPVIKLFWFFLFGCVYLGLIGLVTGSITPPEGKGIWGILWIGLFEMGFTFICWMKALELTSHPARVANLVYLCPFLALLILNRVVGEVITTASWAGLVFIVSGILIQSRSK